MREKDKNKSLLNQPDSVKRQFIIIKLILLLLLLYCFLLHCH